MFTWNCRGRLIQVDKPLVMGIMNITPDSFFADSRKTDASAWLETASRFIHEGATLLDVGGQSTRPGSEVVTPELELERVIPAIHSLRSAFPDILISVDTYYGIVAKKAVEAGASLVNDVSAGQLDPEMIPVVSTLNVPYVLMHMPPVSPGEMQSHIQEGDITETVMDFFLRKIRQLTDAVIRDIILDPGFGFGKTPEQNFQLVRDLNILKSIGKPVLLGVSRKSTICKALGVTPGEALNGTSILNTIGLLGGADILRVHDVKEAVEVVKLVAEIKKPAVKQAGFYK